jgi:penicillin-binding protein activator
MAASVWRYCVMIRGRRRMGCVALALLSLAGCAQETRITRVDSGVVTDLSGRWNDTDSRIVAESMVKEALEFPWLNNFSSSKRRQPVVVVRTAATSISTSTRL